MQEEATAERAAQAAREEEKDQGGGKGGKKGKGTKHWKRGETPEEKAERERLEQRKKQRHEDFMMQVQILKEAEVVCAQIITAGGDFLGQLGGFHGILIDEVAQCTEPSAVVPIALRGCKRLVLAGAHHVVVRGDGGRRRGSRERARRRAVAWLG